MTQDEIRQKRQKVEPAEITMLDLILEIRKLSKQVDDLQEQMDQLKAIPSNVLIGGAR